MSKPHQPVWLNDDDIEEIPFQNQHSSSNSNTNQTSENNLEPKEGGKNWNKNKILYWLFRFVAILLAVLMAITSLIGLSMVTGVDKSGRIFVAVYMLFFAFLLLLFEINEIKPIEKIDFMFRKNFGFMYNPVGKSLFIIFIAFLSFGLGDPQLLTFATGTCLAVFGICQICIYLQYPELLEYNAH